MTSESKSLKEVEKGKTWLESSEVWDVTYQRVQGSFIVRRWWGLSSVSRPNSCACWQRKETYNQIRVCKAPISKKEQCWSLLVNKTNTANLPRWKSGGQRNLSNVKHVVFSYAYSVLGLLCEREEFVRCKFQLADLLWEKSVTGEWKAMVLSKVPKRGGD